MKSLLKGLATSLAAGAALAAGAHAADILVTSNITTSETWTKDNTYNLRAQVFVEDGATLTIEAGTVIASDGAAPGTPGGGLVVARGGQIFALGTQLEPIIFTSRADVATWAVDGSHPTGKNPRTGTWRAAANEWGNVTIMGDAYISEDAIAGNTPAPSAGNFGEMEGLLTPPSGITRYGGGNDDDDSGIFRYVSIRYGGQVLALNSELNGLSLGGIGRGTDIHHVEIMNNVDDGVEIWGGTVNLKYLSIWNIGDDSLDIDQGYRGRIQDVLIVQGYSLDGAQGSGVGDNVCETDGAENSFYQPVTTTTIYNLTAIGQPVPGAGDHGTAWRDNARVQYRNCIFMDLGEKLVAFDNSDGDGGAGYGAGGTLSWADTWTTDSSVTSLVNPFANPAAAYTAQVPGKLAEIKDSVFFRNLDPAAYTEATARGVLPGDAVNNNVLIPGSLDADAPIQTLVRGAPVVAGGKTMLPVVTLDPRPKNAALVSVEAAPDDGVFVPQPYRGAFAPGETWLADWTASDAFGFTQTPGGVAGFGGSVTDALTALPVEGALVSWGAASARTGVDGTYAFEDLPCGTDTLQVLKSGYGPYSLEYSPPCGGVGTVDVQLQPLEAQAGFVLGEVVQGEISTPDDVDVVDFPAVAGTRVSFSYQSLPDAAPILLSVVAPGGSTKTWKLKPKPNGKPVNKSLKLKESGTHSLVVASAPGAPGAYVLASSAKLPKTGKAFEKTKAFKGNSFEPGVGLVVSQDFLAVEGGLAGIQVAPVKPSGLALEIEVLSPSQQAVALDGFLEQGPDGVLTITDLPLAETGTWRVRASSEQGAGGKVKLAVNPAPPVPADVPVDID